MNPIEEKEFLARLAIELEELRNAPPIAVPLSPIEIFAIITQVQLASRHPKNKGWHVEQSQERMRQFQSIFRPGSAIEQILERGWKMTSTGGEK